MRTASRHRAAAVRERPTPYAAGLRGPVYLDSSALLKLYVPEAGSDAFDRVLGGRDDLLASDLTITEIVSALARRVREGGVRPEQARMVQRSVVRALEGGPYGRVELDRGTHRDAERLLLDRRDLTLRAADALHLALALAAGAGTLATFDGRLGAAARALGLGSYPPGAPSRP